MSTPRQERPNEDRGSYTENLDSIIFIADGPGDTSIRPRPANVPRDWPHRPPRPQASQSEQSNGPPIPPKQS
jgi:hypothetical protein